MTTPLTLRVRSLFFLAFCAICIGFVPARSAQADDTSLFFRLLDRYGLETIADTWVRVFSATEGQNLTAQVAGLLPPAPGPSIGAAPTATFSASPTAILTGAPTTLSWTSAGATYCAGTGFDTGGAVSGSASVTPTVTTTYVLTCTGKGGTVTESASVTVNTAPDTTPPQLSGIGALDVSTSTKQDLQAFRITWNTNEPTTAEVQYGTSPTVLTKSVPSSTLSTSHAVVLYGLRKRTQYYYRILATDSAGNSTQNSALSFTTTERPSPVLNLTAAPGSVKLAWTLPVDETIGSLEIHRTTNSTSPAPGSTPLAQIDGSATSYTDSAVAGATSYTYTVYTLTGSDYSSPAIAAFTTYGTSGGGASTGGGSSSSSSGGSGSNAGGTFDGSSAGGGARATGTSPWIHTITPSSGGARLLAMGYGVPYFTYWGITAPVMKVYASGDLIILTAGAGSKLQQVYKDAKILKNGTWHTLPLTGIWPLQSNNYYRGKGYIILRPGDPFYMNEGAFVTSLEMNLPGCSGESCFRPGWRLQEWKR